MARLRQDLAYAIRTLGRTPGFTAIAVLVLAVGIGVNTAIFTLANELLLKPLSGRAGDLVGVYSRDRTVPDSYRPFSYPNYIDIRDSGVFDALFAHTFAIVAESAGDGTRRALADVVSSNYFDVLGVRLAAGRTFTPAEERPGARTPVAIVSHARWARERFDPAFIGRTIRLNAEDFTVIGVAPPDFTGTMAIVAPEFYLPLGMFDALVSDPAKNNGRGLGDRSNAGLVVAGYAGAGLDDVGVTTRLEALSRQLELAHPVENRQQTLSVNPLPRMSGSPAPQTNGPLAAFATLLLSLSGIVLVIACLNIANMLLARGSTRRTELAVRLALGAGRGRVARQLLTESLLLASAAAAIGLLLSAWTIRTLTASIGSTLPFALTVAAAPDLRVLLATFTLAVMSTVASGLGPALRLSRRDLVVDLKERGRDGAAAGRRFSARNLMVAGQIALSLATLTAAGIFARTAVEAGRASPGYADDSQILVSLDARLAGIDASRGRGIYDEVLTRVRSLPGIRAASLTTSIPFGESVEGERFVEAGAEDREPVRARAFRIISADYFETMGLQVMRGRGFTRAEESSPSTASVAIVDEAFARALFGGQDPLGRTIRLAAVGSGARSNPGELMEIVGVAPPLREERLDARPVPHVYVPFGRHYRGGMHLTARTAAGAPAGPTLESVRSVIRSVDSKLPILTLSTLAAFHDRSLEVWALDAGAWLFASLGLLAMLLACIGLYGVKSYVVAERTREIGLRMALGATPGRVIRLVLGDGAVLTAIGVAIGVPLALLVSSAFGAVFVEIGGADTLLIAVAATVLAVAATIAAAVPARRAAQVTPLTALRTD
jgi:predicted permease